MEKASVENGGNDRQSYLRVSNDTYYFRVEYNSCADTVRILLFDDELERGSKHFERSFTLSKFMKKLEKMMREE